MKINRRIIGELLHQFKWQIFLSIGWAVIMTWGAVSLRDGSLIAIKNFFTCLFFLSYFTGQYNRVGKQIKVEDEFETVKGQMNGLIARIEKQTRDLVGFALGGDSIATLSPGILAKTQIVSLTLTNTSEYPVFDFIGDWIDVDEQIDPQKGKYWTRNYFDFGNIYPNKAHIGALQFDFANRDKLNINLFARTRNRMIIHFFRIAKVKGELKIAYKITSEDFIKTKVPEDFPGYDPENPEKVFA